MLVVIMPILAEYMTNQWGRNPSCGLPMFLLFVLYFAFTSPQRSVPAAEVVIAKMTAGKVEENGPAYVDTFEFLRLIQRDSFQLGHSACPG